MTDQHRATPEQWDYVDAWEVVHDCALSSCILELRARVEALEAAPQDKLDRLIALDREDPTPDPAMPELRAASAEAQPAGGLVERLLAPEWVLQKDQTRKTTDGAQLIDGKWWAPCSDLFSMQRIVDNARSLIAYTSPPTAPAPAGGLVERVANAISEGDEPDKWHPEARDAIREVAAWLSEHTDDDASAYWAARLEQEASQ
jgi:hypothetical protein